MGRTQQLIGIAEIADLLKVRANTVSVWRHRGLLPDPDLELAMGGLWKTTAILKWAQQTGRLKEDNDRGTPVGSVPDRN